MLYQFSKKSQLVSENGYAFMFVQDRLFWWASTIEKYSLFAEMKYSAKDNLFLDFNYMPHLNNLLEVPVLLI